VLKARTAGFIFFILLGGSDISLCHILHVKEGGGRKEVERQGWQSMQLYLRIFLVAYDISVLNPPSALELCRSSKHLLPCIICNRVNSQTVL